jgi:hypothetical protein
VFKKGMEQGNSNVNIERKQAMTERKPQQGPNQLYFEAPDAGVEDDENSICEDQIQNPLNSVVGRAQPGWPESSDGFSLPNSTLICERTRAWEAIRYDLISL